MLDIPLLQCRLGRPGPYYRFVDSYEPGPFEPDVNAFHTCEVASSTHQYQITGIYQDMSGNRIHKAEDMQFSNPFWARANARALAQSFLTTDIALLTRVTVPFDKEDDLMEFLRCKHLQADCLIIRVHKPHGRDIDSVFLVTKASKISDWPDWIMGSPEIIPRADFATLLNDLLDVSRDVPEIDRLCMGMSLQERLMYMRALNLISMARQGIPHPLCEGLSPNIPFPARLAAYLLAGDVLLGNHQGAVAYEIVLRSQQLDPYEEDELYRQLDTYYEVRRWRKVSEYAGLPSAGVTAEEACGDYDVVRYNLWAYCERKSPVGPEGVKLPVVDVSKECPPLSWLEETPS